MKSLKQMLSFLPVLALLLQNVAFAGAADEAWIPLFNGKDLNDWTPNFANVPVGENLNNIFRVEDGLLKVSYADTKKFHGEFGHLFYKTPYSHYRVRAEFRFTGEQLEGGPWWAYRNNGLMLHAQAPETMPLELGFPNSVECQFWGNNMEKGEKFSNRHMGNLYTPGTIVSFHGEDVQKQNSSSSHFSGLDWVTVEAEVRGAEEIVHYVNGEEVLRYQDIRLDDGTPLRSGYIAIQAETHPVEFRRIDLLPLSENTQPELFVMPNGLPKLGMDEQASLLKELGYTGVSQLQFKGDVSGLARQIQAYKRCGLKVLSVYLPASVEGLSDDVLHLLASEGLMIELFFREKSPVIMHAMKRSLKKAGELGVEVVIYPHAGFAVETLAQGVSVLEEFGLSHVGLMFNLCHFLKAEPEENVEAALQMISPYLKAVSTSGANLDGRGWPELIQTLDRGSFPQHRLFHALDDVGFKGPVSLQSYNIKGDKAANLERSMAAWELLFKNHEN